MKIWVNTIVQNEENFIWYALMSVIDYVDKVLVWDTGSTDKTVDLIEGVRKKYPKKIVFEEKGIVTPEEFTALRQEMLEKSECDWLLVLDGDEVWWENSIKILVENIQTSGKTLDAVVVPFINFIGDVYHYQEESTGRYHMLGKTGYLTIRAMNRKVPGLHAQNPYGNEGYFDRDNNPIQNRKKLIYIDVPFLHATHLNRSSKKRRFNKLKYELGKPFPENFILPKVFYMKEQGVPDVLSPMSTSFKIKAFIATLLRKVKRMVINER